MTPLRKRRNTRHHEKPAVTVYVTPTCQGCPKTLRVLRDHNISHTVVDLTADLDAYKYVTQDLGHRQAPAVVVHHLFEIVTWSGHRPELIAEHVLQHYRADNTVDDIFEDMIGNSTGPHLHFDTHAKKGQP